MSFLTEIVRHMWCIKGVKINTLVVLGFGWPVAVYFGLLSVSEINTLRPRQGWRHFADDIFMCIFFNENCCILIKFSLKYVRKGPIDNNPALVQMMAWSRPGDKPLSEPMMVSLPTHICVTRPQWVNIKYVYRVLACLVGLTHGCVNLTHHVLWYVLIGYLG